MATQAETHPPCTVALVHHLGANSPPGHLCLLAINCASPPESPGGPGVSDAGEDSGAPEDMGTWVLRWHCSMAAGAQAELPQVVKTISSAKQDAHGGGCLRSPQGTSPSLPWGRNQLSLLLSPPSTEQTKSLQALKNYSLLP